MLYNILSGAIMRIEDILFEVKVKKVRFLKIMGGERDRQSVGTVSEEKLVFFFFFKSSST